MRTFRSHPIVALAIAGVLALPLAACDPPDNTQISNVVQQVQDGARTACGFVPTVATVTQIITAITGGAAAAAAVTGTIQAICNAVAPPVATAASKSVRRRAAVADRVVIVGGHSIAVHGKFVR
jgi:hypothetical protein